MAVSTSYETVGLKEDVSPIIAALQPMDTHLYNRLGRVEVTQRNHQWLTDVLQSAAQNAELEGGAFAEDAINQPTLATNYTQINKKEILISRTADKSAKHGRGSEYQYHKVKKTKELLRDVEFTLMQGTSATGAGAVARSCLGVVNWIAGNINTASANRSLTLAIVNNVLQQVYDDGGNATQIFLPSGLADDFADLAGNTQYRRNVSDPERLVHATEVYASPYGQTLRVDVHRYMPADTIVALDMDFWKVGVFDAPFHEFLGKDGDRVRGHVVAEFTLEARNQLASGKIEDIA